MVESKPRPYKRVLPMPIHLGHMHENTHAQLIRHMAGAGSSVCGAMEISVSVACE